MQELDNLIIDNSYDINKWNEMNLIIEKKKDWLELKEEYKNEDTIYDSLDINNNKRVDWWEVLIGIVFMISFYGLLVCSVLFFKYISNKYGF